MRGTYIFGLRESTSSPRDSRQSRHRLSRSVRARQGFERRAAHGRSRRRLSARAVVTRGPPRHSRRLERLVQPQAPRGSGAQPDGRARYHPPHHQTALGGKTVRRASYVVPLMLLAACGSKADIVIQGGSVWTGLSAGRGRPGAGANGGLVLPGLVDGHTHFIDGGFQLASVDLRNAATPQEFVRRIKEYAGHLKPGEWIVGGDWDHTLWAGAPLPHHEWIDSVTPNNPVFIHRLDGHEALANAAAMRAAKVTRDSKVPFGGEMLRDARGEPTGIFKDNAPNMIGARVPDPTPEQDASAAARAPAYAASLGVTATANMSASWANLAAYKRMERAGRMTARVFLYLPIEDWRAVAESAAHDRGDDWVKIGGVKGYMGGSVGVTATANMSASWANLAAYKRMERAGRMTARVFLYLPIEDWRA